MGEQKKSFIVVKVCYSLIQISLGIFFIAVFAEHGSDECEHPIATYLLVTGIANIVLTLFLNILPFTLKRFTEQALQAEVKEEDKMKGLGASCWIVCIFCLLFAFLTSWFIIGNVWVFSTNPDNCNDFVYKVGFWYLIATYIMAGVAMCLSCCVSICTCICAGTMIASNVKSDPESGDKKPSAEDKIAEDKKPSAEDKTAEDSRSSEDEKPKKDKPAGKKKPSDDETPSKDKPSDDEKPSKDKPSDDENSSEEKS